MPPPSNTWVLIRDTNDNITSTWFGGRRGSRAFTLWLTTGVKWNKNSNRSRRRRPVDRVRQALVLKHERPPIACTRRTKPTREQVVATVMSTYSSIQPHRYVETAVLPRCWTLVFVIVSQPPLAVPFHRCIMMNDVVIGVVWETYNPELAPRKISRRVFV